MTKKLFALLITLSLFSASNLFATSFFASSEFKKFHTASIS